MTVPVPPTRSTSLVAARGAPCLAALAAVLTALVAPVPAPAAAAVDGRGDVRTLLGPVTALERAAGRHGAGLAAAGARWADEVHPCVRSAYDAAERLVAEGRLRPSEGRTAVSAVFGIAVVDAMQALGDYLDEDLAAAQQRFRRMRVRDSVLRAGARGKAREIGTLRGMQDVRTCSFVRAWDAADFSPAVFPLEQAGVDPAEFSTVAGTRPVARAARRLRRLGVDEGRVTAFRLLPLAQLVDPSVLGDTPPDLRRP